ncbi:MAG: L,D-transpeptidase family protein [Pseudomonadota bacterium]
MDLFVFANGFARWGETRLRCALGRAGVQTDKREGDGATPVGVFPLRRVLYRPDRLKKPETRLPLAALRPQDGWCDAPDHPDYNRPVTFPFAASAEALWREDALYDLVLIPGFNDSPVVPGKGSAIFVHLAGAGYAATEGCVAFDLADLQQILRQADTHARLCISQAPL